MIESPGKIPTHEDGLSLISLADEYAHGVTNCRNNLLIFKLTEFRPEGLLMLFHER
jgi:hypothetical protein